MDTLMSSSIDLSTSRLRLRFAREQSRLLLREYASTTRSWLNTATAATVSTLFALDVNGQRFDAASLDLVSIDMDYSAAGVQYAVMQFTGAGFEVEHHLKAYQDTALTETWQVLRNTGDQPLRVSRMDSFGLGVSAGTYDLMYYTSDWGSEFEPVRQRLDGETVLETRRGRSSKGMHPWFALFDAEGRVLSGSVAWSGNWVIRFEPAEGGYHLSGGLHDWEFSKALSPGEAMDSPPMVLVLGDSLNDTSQQYASVGRRHWYPRNALSALAPVEWNHWWSYEDDHINETVFMQNTDVAAEHGVDICMLDAGWFGPSDAGTFWVDYRGDWDLVNTVRFPNGLRPLADNAHAKGVKFGMWCEIEAVGEKARVVETHPELIARRDGQWLGYVCMGNPQTQEWAYQTLSRLIRENDLDWIKLDFNLDPGAGCNRTDHGHGAGDGLYEHYRGYYRLLERVRADFPHVVLENCSSGGLRIDLGIMRRLDMTFLSDPDWPIHNLQLFWGATTMLAPDSCLHWGYSEWIGKNPPPYQTFNPRDPKLTPHQLDYYTRTSMLNVFGFSQKLIDLPAWVTARFDHHTQVYKSYVRRFVREARLYHLTGQPKRDGTGDRWTAFQYSLPDHSEHLLFVFRLPGAEAERTIRLEGLQPDRVYQIEGFEGERIAPRRGCELMEQGIVFNTLPEEGSALFRIL